MYARVVRFTGADAETLGQNLARMRESSGPPEGVRSTALTVMADDANGTIVSIGFFETEEDMRDGDEVLNSMTPPGGEMGTRVSVDLCEIKLELQAP
ncbi:hypothetical protein BH10ACT11_BH10ACT11_14770 [soil metagenome]